MLQFRNLLKLTNKFILFFAIKLIWVTILFYNILDYGNEFIEHFTSIEIIARNYLPVIEASINENIILRNDFDIYEDRKN